ncbi:MAG: thioredoxin family protein [bacterium]|nr:thioredoxin family protein [bacterium]
MNAVQIQWTPKELTGDQLAPETQRTDYPVFIDFWANWCKPCKSMEPLIEDFAQQYKEQLVVRKIDIDIYPGVIDQFKVFGVPTFVIFKEGKEVWRYAGVMNNRQLNEAADAVIGSQ